MNGVLRAMPTTNQCKGVLNMALMSANRARTIKTSIKRRHAYQMDVFDPDISYTAGGRFVLCAGARGGHKKFYDVEIDITNNTWTCLVKGEPPVTGRNPYNLLQNMYDRHLVPRTYASNNHGAFVVTYDGGSTWYNALEWKYYVANCLGIKPIMGKTRVRLPRPAA